MYIAVIVAIMHVRSYVNYCAFSFYADMHVYAYCNNHVRSCVLK